jgi:hypothetical protein
MTTVWFVASPPVTTPAWKTDLVGVVAQKAETPIGSYAQRNATTPFANSTRNLSRRAEPHLGKIGSPVNPQVNSHKTRK